MENKKNIIISDSLVADVRTIIEEGRRHAFAAVGQVAILTYWNVGRRIVEEKQQGYARARYGKGLIPALADRLTTEMVPDMVGAIWLIIENSIWNSVIRRFCTRVCKI